MSIDIGQMLINLSQSYSAIFKMVTAIAYVMGLSFLVMSIFSFKQYAESHNSMSGGGLKAPLLYILVATVFLYLPSAIDTLMESTFGAKDTALSYSDSGDMVSMGIQEAVFRLSQIVGLIAFIRGWLILAQSAKQGAQPALGRALTHIIGGILAINIVGTKNVIWATFGLAG